MKRALLSLVGALSLIVIPLSAAEISYSDPAGDSGPAPDITTVSVSNTEDGTTTFKIGIGNYASSFPQFPTALMVWVNVSLDLDKSAATGVMGAEAQISLDGRGTLELTRWNGTDLAEVAQPQLTSSFANGLITFTIARRELMDTKGFAFSVRSFYIPGPPGGVVSTDSAPNRGLPDLTYDLVLPAPLVVKPIIGKPMATPAAPVAGKRFTVSFPVTSSVDGKPLTTGTAECKTTVAGKTVPHTHTFSSGTLKATVKVPKAAQGKQLKIAVKVIADSAATKVFTFKVK
jgi:hypothetical protein